MILTGTTFLTDHPITVYEQLDKPELQKELEKLGLKYNIKKTLNQNTLRLNTWARSSHPLNGFIKSLQPSELTYLYKYYNLNAKAKNLSILVNKILSLSPKDPIHFTIAILSGKPAPEQLKAKPTLGNSHFDGLPLQNPNTTCYMNAAINSLAGCDMVRKILTNPEITDGPNFYTRFINELPAENKAPQNPESMRVAVTQIFTSLSNILHKKINSIT